jgi:TetR/AcrR family transcriptional regulator, transcriptional repressor for nem operon
MGGISRDFDEYPKSSLRDFLELELEFSHNRREYLIAYSKEKNQPLSSNYFSVTFEAARILPEFRKDLDLFRNRELKAWTAVVKHARHSGEIQSDMSNIQIARLFLYVNKGLGMQLIMDDNFGELHKELRVLWMAIYNGLKVHHKQN